MKSCREELLDHVVVFGERHFRELVRSYVGYHNQDRSHYALENRDAPMSPMVQHKPLSDAKVIALPRV